MKIGTRGSKLALWQANRVLEGLGQGELEIIKTTGDRFQDIPLTSGIGLFTKAIEEVLRLGEVDLAVHSLKDLPVRLIDGMVLGAHLRREHPADVLLVRPGALDEDRELPLKEGATVGTSAVRRQALLHRYRPDLKVEPVRGNVPTRVRKCVDGPYDALLMARPGLARLGLDPSPLLAFQLDLWRWPCAPGQGVVAVEVREESTEVLRALEPLNHKMSRAAATAERELLLASGGGCHTAFAAHARHGDDAWAITVAMPGPTGRFHLACFACDTLAAGKAEARAWVLAGAPTDTDDPEVPLCRPDRWWS